MFDENEIVPHAKKPFLIFCHHDTVKDQNGMFIPTHFSILTCTGPETDALANDKVKWSFEVSTNAIYCQNNGQIKFNNGYPPIKPSELIATVREVFERDKVEAVQILKSEAQMYYVREFLQYRGTVIQVYLEHPYKDVVTADNCIFNTNHNTFSCSHCLLSSVLNRKLPGFAAAAAKPDDDDDNR